MAVHQLEPVSHGLRNRPPTVQPFGRGPLARHAKATARAVAFQPSASRILRNRSGVMGGHA